MVAEGYINDVDYFHPYKDFMGCTVIKGSSISNNSGLTALSYLEPFSRMKTKSKTELMTLLTLWQELDDIVYSDFLDKTYNMDKLNLIERFDLTSSHRWLITNYSSSSCAYYS